MVDPLLKNYPPPQSDSSDGKADDAFQDTVIGLNARLSDNLIQAIVILLFVVCSGAGCVLFSVPHENDWRFNALMGAFAGLVVGLLFSGMCIGIYRALFHLNKRKRTAE